MEVNLVLSEINLKDSRSQGAELEKPDRKRTVDLIPLVAVTEKTRKHPLFITPKSGAPIRS